MSSSSSSSHEPPPPAPPAQPSSPTTPSTSSSSIIIISHPQPLSVPPGRINEPDSSGQTALHRAVIMNLSPAQIQELLDAGAALNQPDEERRTALHHAVEAGLKDLVRFLVSCPLVEVNAVDVLNRTPLHVGKKNLSIPSSWVILMLQVLHGCCCCCCDGWNCSLNCQGTWISIWKWKRIWTWMDTEMDMDMDMDMYGYGYGCGYGCRSSS